MSRRSGLLVLGTAFVALVFSMVGIVRAVGRLSSPDTSDAAAPAPERARSAAPLQASPPVAVPAPRAARPAIHAPATTTPMAPPPAPVRPAAVAPPPSPVFVVPTPAPAPVPVRDAGAPSRAAAPATRDASVAHDVALNRGVPGRDAAALPPTGTASVPDGGARSITNSSFDHEDRVDPHPTESSFDREDKIDRHPVP